MIDAKIICDSINQNGDRITSWILKYPRFIHSEVMTHRMFSRNAASSRAIPIKRMIEAIQLEPAMPMYWGKNQPGMQAAEELSTELQSTAAQQWVSAAEDAIKHVNILLEIGVHKQIANRLLEPFAHMTTLVTATCFENFFSLRAHEEAQPEFRYLAELMLDVYNNSTPEFKEVGEWHLPFGDRMPTEIPVDTLAYDNSVAYFTKPRPIITADKLKIVTARAARVSYNTFDGVIDPIKDFRLHDSLASSGHWSPFEHAAQAMDKSVFSGNFKGWMQYRKTFQGENRTDSRVIKKAP